MSRVALQSVTSSHGWDALTWLTSFRSYFDMTSCR